MDIMKRVTFLLSVVLFLIAKHTTYAANSVTVTNSGNGTSETHVKIETDGEVKSFDTTDGENVDWTSDDGKSTVKITTNTKNPTPAQTSQTKNKTEIRVNQSNDDNSPTPTKGEGKTTQKVQMFSLADFFKNIFAFFGFRKSQ